MTSSSPYQRRSSRLSLAHDYLLVMRGAERTFAAIADLYPGAPIYTLLYDEQGTASRFTGHEVVTSPLQRLGVRQQDFRRLLPLYPWAAGRLRPSDCEVVLSSSSAFAHGLRVPPGAAHVCYCHTPFRYAWYEQERALVEIPRIVRPALRRQLARMREWDLEASGSVDFYIANSKLTQERIGRYYGRDSTVIHPPVDTARFHIGSPGKALLVVSEIVRHKRLDVALEAARRTGAAIQVVGGGPEQPALERAYPEAEFLGRASDERLVELYAQARAVVVPSVEEFGIVAVEAQAAGRPVIAAGAGGALESVIDGRTGLLFAPGDVESLASAIRELDRLDFDPRSACESAERFSVGTFQAQLAREVARIAEEGPRRDERGG